MAQASSIENASKFLKRDDNKVVKLNLIFKQNGLISQVKEYDYDCGYNENLYDLADRIVKEDIFGIGQSWKYVCEYDKKSMAKLFQIDSERNNKRINWNLNLNDYSIRNYSDYLRSNISGAKVTIWCSTIGGWGAGATKILLIVKILKFIYDNILPLAIGLYLFINRTALAYKKMEEVTGYDKDFIIEVIKSSLNWNRDFITNYYFCDKRKLEKIIMKDLRYKFNKKSKTWHYVN